MYQHLPINRLHTVSLLSGRTSTKYNSQLPNVLTTLSVDTKQLRLNTFSNCTNSTRTFTYDEQTNRKVVFITIRRRCYKSIFWILFSYKKFTHLPLCGNIYHHLVCPLATEVYEFWPQCWCSPFWATNLIVPTNLF